MCYKFLSCNITANEQKRDYNSFVGVEQKMIGKNELEGKYVTYYWKHKRDPFGSLRTGKVIKISGNTLTVQDAAGTKRRIHPKKMKILGRQFHKRGVESIKW